MLDSNVIVFRPRGQIATAPLGLLDPLDRQNLEHAFVAMHVAAQYDEDRADDFIRGHLKEGRIDDLEDLIRNNLRAIRYLRSAFEFLQSADEVIVVAMMRVLTEALADGGHAHGQ